MELPFREHLCPPASGVVHIWSMAVFEDEHPSPDFACLSIDEKERVRRFRSHNAARSFAATRVALRKLIGTYMQIPSAAVEFGYSETGKPYLKHPYPTGLEFNVSHSGGLSTVLFATETPVGIDIEQHDTQLDFTPIASLIFSHEENVTLAAVPVSERRAEFFRYWTRKEAYLKCVGAGLGQSPENVTATPSCDPAVTVLDVALLKSLSCAIAARTHIADVKLMEFNQYFHG